MISDLFTTKNLGESTIYGIPKTLHHTAMKTVYEKVMNDYCQKIKGFDCSVQRKGCSINGACDELKETCFDDPREPDGYRCEGMSPELCPNIFKPCSSIITCQNQRVPGTALIKVKKFPH